MTIGEYLKSLEKSYQDHSDEDRADKMKAYMRGQFSFLGITSPVRKELFREDWKSNKAFISHNFREIITKLWKKEHREYLMLAMEILKKCEKQLMLDDLPFILDLVTSYSWWDTVDFLASNSVGYIIKMNKEEQHKQCDMMMKSDNIWLQRTAILHQLKWKDETNRELLFDLILKTQGSKEFFINKACGWSLRQLSRYDKKKVTAFIENNNSKLSKLTIREGSKYL